MHRKKWPARAAVLWSTLFAMAAAAPAAHAARIDALDRQAKSWLQAPERALRLNDVDYIQLVASETGARNEQPARINASALATFLSGVGFSHDGEAVTLFSESEVAKLAPIAAAVLEKARANQDLVFVMTDSRQVFSLLGKKVTCAGRLFIADGMLNLIVGEQQSEALQNLRPHMRPAAPFSTGSRAQASAAVALNAPVEGVLKRADWVAFPVGMLATATPAVPTTPATPAAGASQASPAGATVPAAQIDPDEAKRFAKQKSRLLLLQQMREQGVISDKEYEQKRADILKEL